MLNIALPRGRRRSVVLASVLALSLSAAALAVSGRTPLMTNVADDIPRGGQVKAGPPVEDTPYLLHTVVGNGYHRMEAVAGGAGGEVADPEAEAPERKAGPKPDGGKKDGKDKGKKNGKDKGKKNGKADRFPSGDVQVAAGVEPTNYFNIEGESSAVQSQWWYARDVKTVGKSYVARWENLAFEGKCLAGRDGGAGLKPCKAGDPEQTWTATPMTGKHGYKMTPGKATQSLVTKLTEKNVDIRPGRLTDNPIPDVLMKKVGSGATSGQLFYWDDCNCGLPEI